WLCSHNGATMSLMLFRAVDKSFLPTLLYLPIVQPLLYLTRPYAGPDSSRIFDRRRIRLKKYYGPREENWACPRKTRKSGRHAGLYAILFGCALCAFALG